MSETNPDHPIPRTGRLNVGIASSPRHGKFGSLKEKPGRWLFVLIVAIPMILYSGYLSFVASPRYVSEFRVMIRSPGQSRDMNIPQLAGLSLSSQANENSYAVIQYLKSQAAALELDRTLGIRNIYSKSTIDPMSRLPPRPSNAELTRYWNGKLDAYYENTTSTVVARVTGFDPATANRISNATLALSEKLVNGMSRRSRQDMVSYAQRDVDVAGRELQGIDDKLYALRNERGLIDPHQTAAAVLTRQSQIQAQLTAATVDIDARSPYQSPSSPIIQALKKRREALTAALKAISGEEVAKSAGSGETLSGSIAAFEKLQADEEFAQKHYQVALAGLQTARDGDARQQLYLDTIVPPTLPDESSYPNYLKQLGLFFLISCALWAICTAVVANIAERT